MKTLYLIKSALPFVFLPIAPGVVQVELERSGVLTVGSGTFLAVLLQIAFTLGLVVWFSRTIPRRDGEKGFLKMSCVSKKVFHQGEWMSVEQYLSENHNIEVSHGMTPEESTAWVQESEEWLRQEKKSEGFDREEISAVRGQGIVIAK